MASDTPHHETVLEATGMKARIARVYAEGLMVAAGQANQTDAIGDELHELVKEVLDKNPAIEQFLGSGAIGKKTKGPILLAALERNSSETLRKFLGVLNQNGRLGLLRAVNAAYQKIRDEAAGNIRVKVTAPVELNGSQIDRLKQTLSKTLQANPLLDVRVNPELLGGLVVQVGDTVYDTSVRSRLDNLRTHLMASSSNG